VSVEVSRVLMATMLGGEGAPRVTLGGRP
jgi:hypothetical protein